MFDLEKYRLRARAAGCRAWLGGLWAGVILCAGAGCQPDTVCRQELDAAMGVSVEWVLTDSTGAETTMTQWDSVEIWGMYSDTVPYLNVRNTSRIWLPLRVDTGVTTYQIAWHGQTDFIEIHHSNDRQFISNACGCMVFHTIDTVLFGGTVVDSVEILNSIISNAEEENIVLIMNDELGIKN